MDLGLTEEQEAIRRAVRELAWRFDDDYWLERDRNHEFPWDFYRAVAEAGWLGVAIPREYGGAGLGLVEASLIVQEIAASGAAINGCSAIHLTIFGMNTVVKHGSEELRARTLPRVVTGDLHVAFAVTEPDAGTATTRITTFARREGDEYVVRGRMVRPIEKLGRNAVPSNELFIDDLASGSPIASARRGTASGTSSTASTPSACCSRTSRWGSAAPPSAGRPSTRASGSSSAGRSGRTRASSSRSRTRLRGSTRRSSSRGVRRGSTTRGCRARARRTRRSTSAPTPPFQAADRAVQTLGGMGYAREYHVERYFREARLMRLAPVSQELALSYLGEHVLGLPKSY